MTSRDGTSVRTVAGQPMSTPVVGRVAELAELEAALESARRGRGTLFAIVGEPGIGKTRLAEAIADHAADTDALVLWGTCWESGGAPAFWPWIQIVRALAETYDPDALRAELGSGAQRVAQMVPELCARLPGLEPAADVESEWARFTLFDAVTSFLRSASRRRPLLFVIEDAHAADQPSLLLLAFLARALHDARILVVLTYREAEMREREDAEGLVGELVRFGRRIPLRGLDSQALAKFLEATSGRPAPDSLVGAVHGVTEGNPFFVTEVIRLLHAEGWLADPSLVPARLPLPTGVREAIRRRLAPLSDDARRTLAVASVIGREFRVDALAAAAGRDAADVIAALEEATRAGMAREMPDRVGRYAFSHGLVMEVVLDSLPAAVRADLHRAVGETLERTYGARADLHLAELAHHFVAAALVDVAKALDYARRAGHGAMAVLAYEEAVAHYSQAVRLLELMPQDDEARCDLMLALGAAQTRAGQTEAARSTFLETAELARRIADAARFARAALGLGAVGLPPAIVDEQLVSLLDEALAMLDDRPCSLRARVLARLAVALHWSHDHERRLDLVEQAERIARERGDARALARTLVQVQLATLGPDSVHHLERIAEIERIAREIGDRELELAALSFRVPVELELDRVADAARGIDTVRRLARALHQPRHLWYSEIFDATLTLVQGRFEDAERHRTAALEIGRKARGSIAEAAAGAHLFATRWLQGRLPELEDPTRRYVEVQPLNVAWRCDLCLILASAGREAEARHELDALALDEFDRIPRNVVWLACLAILAESVSLLGDAERARRLTELLSPYAERNVVLTGAACVGPVRRFLGILARAQDQHDAAVEHLSAARRRAQANDMRPVLAQLDLDEARTLLDRGAGGDRERAATLAERARAAAAGLGMDGIAERAAEVLQAAGGRPRARPAPAPPAAASLAREGDVWSFAFEGRDVRVRDSKGLHYLATLLESPGVEVHALDLMARGGAGAPVASIAAAAEAGLDVQAAGAGDAGPVLDSQAKRQYRARLEELREEVEEAESFNDPERASRAREEMAFIAAELAGAVGLGGRDRRASSDAERARVNVTRAIRTSLRHVAEHDPELGRELETTVHTGTFCVYEPDRRRPVAWAVER